MSDGWIVPFVLAAGLTGAGLTAGMVCQVGLAATLTAAIAMWLGTYFSAKEQAEDPDDEKMWQLYRHIGLSQETQQIIREEMAADEARWQQKMQEDYQLADARQIMTGTGWQIALAYVLSGLLSLLPFFFLAEAATALYWSAGITGGGLFILSVWRSRLLSLPLGACLLRYFSLAGITAAMAYFIGSQLG